jgi:hypothetical protein
MNLAPSSGVGLVLQSGFVELRAAASIYQFIDYAAATTGASNHRDKSPVTSLLSDSTKDASDSGEADAHENGTCYPQEDCGVPSRFEQR